MPRALVTGATGQVGSYVIERLLADGWRVRALVRDPQRAAWLASRDVDLAHGDILDAPSFTGAAAGCDVVIHAAALVTGRAGWEAFHAANVRGTQNAVAAASAACARLLHVSSVAVYGGAARYRERPTDEDAPLPPLAPGAFYARSKRDAESAVLAAHASGRLWACAVRPDVIYGRRDRQFVPRIARVLRSGTFPMVGGGRNTLAVVHAASVADGAVRAVCHDAAGGRAFNLANDFPITLRAFVRLAASALGRRVVPVPISRRLALAGFTLAAGAMHIAGRGALGAHASGAFDFLTRDNPFSSERARCELGWAPPTPPAIGVPDAFGWWKEHHAS